MANAVFKDSAPLMERIILYSNESDLLTDLGNRVVKRKRVLECPSFSYDVKEEVYPTTIVLEGESQKKTIPSPSFAINHLIQGYLKLGDNTKLIESCVSIDKLLDPYGVQLVDGKEVKVKIDRHDNIDRYNTILKDMWKYRRVENNATSDIVAHEVFDSFTPKGSIRAYSTKSREGRKMREYVHISDHEVLTEKVKPALDELNIELDFLKGFSTALMTRADYIRRNPTLSNSDITAVGLTFINSEFKFKSLQIVSQIYVPNLKIGVVGTTRNTMGKIAHIGDKVAMDKMIKAVLDQVLGNTDAFNARFQRLATEQWLELKDLEQWDLRASLNISQEKIDNLIEIIEEEGLPHTIKGITYALMKKSGEATTLSEMERYNDLAQDIINAPERFEQGICVKENPEDFIEIPREKTERTSTPRTKKVIPVDELEQL